MSRLGDEGVALVALQIAALREAGWPAGRALSTVAQGLSAGTTKAELVRLASALERGEAPVPPEHGGDPLVGLLSRGDAATAAALRGAAEALLDRWEATLAVRMVMAPAFAAAAIAALLLCCLGWFVTLSGVVESVLQSSLPAATRLALRVFDAMKWAGAPIAAVLVAAGWLFPARWTPGARELAMAASLRLRNAEEQAAPRSPNDDPFRDPTLGLRPELRHLAAALMGHYGRRFAVDAVAGALEEVGAKRQRFWAAQLPVGFALLLVWLVGPLILALFLPIFRIAGSIQ